MNDSGVGRKRVRANGASDREMKETEGEVRCVAELKNDLRDLGRSESGRGWR